MDGPLRVVASALAATSLAAAGCGSGATSQAPPAPRTPPATGTSPATETAPSAPATGTAPAAPSSPASSSAPGRPVPGRSLPATTPEERTSALVRPSIVYIKTNWSGYLRNLSTGKIWKSRLIGFTSTCTGFVVNPDGYIVTAGHCVDPGIDGASRIFFDTVIKEERKEGNKHTKEELDRELVGDWVVEGQTAGTPADREVRVQQGVDSLDASDYVQKRARVLMFEPVGEGDVALLKIESENLTGIEVAPEGVVEIGLPVLAIGYSGSKSRVTDRTLEPSNKDGKVSARDTRGGVPVYEISAPVSDGMSGGPVVETSSARAIGLISFNLSEERQPFNFVASSALIRELLGRNAVRNDIGATGRHYRTALEDYWAGDYAGAIREFDAVLTLVPSHRQAQEYRTRAVARMAERSGPSPS
ncbi:S1 family peptidase [Streptosporangium sp. NPDC003464]